MEWQSYGHFKPAVITTCTHLAEHFTEKVLQKYFQSDELHLVFDRYDFPLYLKSATWVRRQGDQHPVYYRVTDSLTSPRYPWNVCSLTKEPRWHWRSIYQPRWSKDQNAWKRMLLWPGGVTVRELAFTTWEAAKKRQTPRSFSTLSMLLLVVELKWPSIHQMFFSLSSRRYPRLCSDVWFVTGTRQRHRVINLKHVVHAGKLQHYLAFML